MSKAARLKWRQIERQKRRARERFTQVLNDGRCLLCGGRGAVPATWKAPLEISRQMGVGPGKHRLFGYMLCDRCVRDVPNRFEEIENKLIEGWQSREVRKLMTPAMERQVAELARRDVCLLCGGSGTEVRVWPPPPELRDRLSIPPDALFVYPFTICPTCCDQPDAPERIADAIVARSDELDRHPVFKMTPPTA